MQPRPAWAVTVADSDCRLVAANSPSHDKQLYEGVRFAWLCFAVRCPWTGGDAAPAPAATPPAIKPWRITALRLVAK
eukprot:COSAG04_NODE_24910_length_315_cov_0.712963_2_plen_76_part_01